MQREFIAAYFDGYIRSVGLLKCDCWVYRTPLGFPCLVTLEVHEHWR